MNTSNFSISGNLEKAVSIACWNPSGWKGRTYKDLAPTKELLEFYKTTNDVELFTSYYISLVLNNLNPEKVYNELGDDAILLCWEKRGHFCHRHIVAEWFYQTLDIKVIEL